MDSSLANERQRQTVILDILAREWNHSGLRHDGAYRECERYVPDIHRRLLAGVSLAELEEYLLGEERALADLDGRLAPSRDSVVSAVAQKLVGLNYDAAQRGGCRGRRD